VSARFFNSRIRECASAGLGLSVPADETERKDRTGFFESGTLKAIAFLLISFALYVKTPQG
jgi:hypothetical protein